MRADERLHVVGHGDRNRSACWMASQPARWTARHGVGAFAHSPAIECIRPVTTKVAFQPSSASESFLHALPALFLGEPDLAAEVERLLLRAPLQEANDSTCSCHGRDLGFICGARRLHHLDAATQRLKTSVERFAFALSIRPPPATVAFAPSATGRVLLVCILRRTARPLGATFCTFFTFG
jgi:hypothetical protein